jgi:hypothetical protein
MAVGADAAARHDRTRQIVLGLAPVW